MINNVEESVCKVNQGYIRKFYHEVENRQSLLSD